MNPVRAKAMVNQAIHGRSEDKAMRAAVRDVQRLVGYEFRDPTLLEEALTHSSHVEYPSYDRLETVGDAALTLAFINYFFLTNPDLSSGTLTDLRAANTSTEKLARAAVRHDLYRFLRHNTAEFDRMVEEFTQEVMKERDEDCSGISYGGNALKAPKVLADIVESIAAAIYVDCNFNLEIVWKVFRGLLEPIITSESLDEQPVRTLHEYCDKYGLTVDIKNCKNGNINITKVFVNGELVGVGSSEHRIIARLKAARDALQKLPGIMQTDMVMHSPVIAVDDNEEGAKQKLMVLCNKKRWPKPVYKIKEEHGPDHDKRFVCSVKVGNQFVECGDLKPRVKDAENSAAFKLLYKILNKNGAW